jgi:hypothetical protein
VKSSFLTVTESGLWEITVPASTGSVSLRLVLTPEVSRLWAVNGKYPNKTSTGIEQKIEQKRALLTGLSYDETLKPYDGTLKRHIRAWALYSAVDAGNRAALAPTRVF